MRKIRIATVRGDEITTDIDSVHLLKWYKGCYYIRTVFGEHEITESTYNNLEQSILLLTGSTILPIKEG